MQLNSWLADLYSKLVGPRGKTKECRRFAKRPRRVAGVELLESRRLLSGVNHAPVGTSGTVTTGENIAYAIKTSDFGFTDPNDSPPNSLQAVKFSLLPTAGTLKDNGTAVTANQFVSAADISGGKLIFTPNNNVLGSPLFLCKFQVQDDGGTAGGGADLDPTAKVLDVNIVKINHAPIGTSGTVTTGQNVPYAVKTVDFGFTDPNDSPANSLMAVKFTLLPSAGTLKDNGVALSVNQFVSATDIGGGKLIFTPNNNVLGSPLFLCKFQVEDNGGTANGGSNLDSTARVLDINIVKVNHAPVGTSKTVTTLEDTAYILKTTDFGFTDPNDSPPNSLKAVKFSLLPSAGTLKDNGTAISVNQFVSAADISGGKLVFAPNTNVNGGGLFLAKFQVQDNGGTAAGGVDLDPVSKVLKINITSVNDAPVGTPKTVTIAENTPYSFKTTDFGFTDPNDPVHNSLLAVKITTLPLAGSLTDNNVAVTAGTHIAVADISAGKLRFIPAFNGTGAAYASFTFQVQDNGGTANGGVDTDPTPRTMTISVNATAGGPDTLVNTYTGSNQVQPAVAQDSQGDYVTVWASYGQDGSGYGVYGQRFNAAGTKQGNEFRVNTTTTETQSHPSIAMDANGDFVVVWQSYTQDGSSYGVYAQRYNSSGIAQGSEFRVNTYTTSGQSAPSVAMDSNGNFVVAWQSFGQDGDNFGIYARRFSSTGSPLSAEFRVNTYTTDDQEAPRIAMDATGDFVVTWMSYKQNSGDFDIYAQRFNSAGAAQGAEFRVNTLTTSHQIRPSVGMDSTGDFVVAWDSYGADGSANGISAQRYNSAGTKVGGELQVNTYTTGAQTRPSVAMDSAGDFAIGWASANQDGSSFGIYAQRYNSSGTRVGAELRVNTQTNGPQITAALSMDASGDLVVAFAGSSTVGGQYDIYDQRFAHT
jgi:hypothetical protein